MSAAEGRIPAGSAQGDISCFRNLFPLLSRAVYLNSCAKGALCTPVREAYLEYLRDWDEHGGPWPLWMEKAEKLRGSFAGFIGAKPSEIALALSVSSAADSVASAMEYGRRRGVVLGDQEYPTMAQIWLAQAGSGAKVDWVRSRTGCPTPEDYEEVVTDETLLVPLTHVSFRTGATLPVKEITEVCHRRGAYVLLDDYQSSGTRPINVKDLGVDFLVTGMLKYLIGPPGIAFLYVREDLIPKLRPRVTGWFGRQDPFSLQISQVDYADTARRFETGTFPVGAIYGSLAALAVLSAFGLERIREQIARLTQRALLGLRQLGFDVSTPPDSHGPMVAIETEELELLLAHLRERNILIAGRNNLFRASFHAYNTLEDVEALLVALRDWRQKCPGEGPHARRNSFTTLP